MNKPASELIALQAERAELMAKNAAATSWGAAVGARHERIKEIDGLLAANQSGSERAGVDALREALKPFADAVYSDNGDVTLSTSYIKTADYLRARNVYRSLATPPAQPAPAATHGDGYCGCTERCKDRDNCQYDVKPEDFNNQDEVLLAYGLLWCVNTSDKRVHSARRELLKCLNRELQAKAISAARTTMALVRDIRQMKGATFAADFDKPDPSESTSTHGKPDGAVREALLSAQAALSDGAFTGPLINDALKKVSAAIDRLDVKAEAKSQEPDAVAIKPLEWGPYPNPVFASDDVAVANVSVFGGHKYQAQRDPNAFGYISYLAPQFGTLFWKSKGHACLDAAKAAAQADYERRISSALIHPTTKPEAPAVSVDAETIDAVARIIDPTAWKMQDGYWMEQEHAYEAISKATTIAAFIAGGR